EDLFRDFGLNELVDTIVSIGYWLNSLGRDAAWLQARVQDQCSAALDLEREIGDEIRKYGGMLSKIGELADELDAHKAKHPLRNRGDFRALLPKIGQIAGVENSGRLSAIAGLFMEQFRSKKRAANAMDFDDLLLGARDLLKQNDGIRRQYQNHFHALL